VISDEHEAALVKEEADLHADSRSEQEDRLAAGLIACFHKRDNRPVPREPGNFLLVASSREDVLYSAALRDKVDQVEGTTHG
jgi:hypothetical protein